MIRKQYYNKTSAFTKLDINRNRFEYIYNKLFSHTGKTLGSVRMIYFKDLEKVEEYLNNKTIN